MLTKSEYLNFSRILGNRIFVIARPYTVLRLEISSIQGWGIQRHAHQLLAIYVAQMFLEDRTQMAIYKTDSRRYDICLSVILKDEKKQKAKIPWILQMAQQHNANHFVFISLTSIFFLPSLNSSKKTRNISKYYPPC